MQRRNDTTKGRAGAERPGRQDNSSSNTGPASSRTPAPTGPTAHARAGIAERLREEIGAEAYERYLGRGAQLVLSDKELCVTVPSRFAADVINQRFGPAIRRAISACSQGGGVPVRFDVRPDHRDNALDRSKAGPADTFSKAGSPTDAAPGREAARGPNRARGTGARGARPSRPDIAPRTLESFIVGRTNRMAFEAARRIVHGAPGEQACPLFVYGPCGVGKSHLLAAIADRFASVYEGARVRLVSAEAFTNEYITAVRANEVRSFHRAFRRIDLLCIDDVHFLAKKNGTQTELLHTFDTLDLKGARIVLASDNHPRQIKAFSGALVSRFMAGSLTRIEAPDDDLRRRMIRAFAARAGLRLDEGIAEMLADGVAGDGPADAPSARDIIGLVNRLQAYVRLTGVGRGAGSGAVDASVAAAVLRSIAGAGEDEPDRPSRPVPIEQILDAVCTTLEVSRADLAGRGRQRAVVLARSLVALLARRLTRRSYPEIAEAMGRSNHSTIITAFRRIEGQMSRGDLVDAGLHFDGLPISALAERIERALRGGRAAR